MLMHPQWDEFCDKTIIGHNCSDGEVVFENGVRIAQFGTAYGDGCYADQLGNECGVDAGLIGGIRVEDINDLNSNLDDANIIEFTSDFECYSENGVIHFGHIAINTGNEEDEE